MITSNRRIRFLIMVLLCCIHCSTYAFHLNSEKILNEKIQNTLDVDRIKYHLPALSVSIELPNNFTRNYVSGYYSLSEKKKITPDTLFQIGSITKTFTATIIFKLVEENKLNVNDKLIKWLPQYPRWKNITVK